MTHQAIKAIETMYNGYRFRSRLEARWAVFFDALGIKYEYEKEGFDLGDGLRYLPDFWLPDNQCWIEIKPDRPDHNEREKASRLATASQHDVYVFENFSIDVGEIKNGWQVPSAWHFDYKGSNDSRLGLPWGYSWCQCAYCGRVEMYQPEGDCDGSFVMHPSCLYRAGWDHLPLTVFECATVTPHLVKAYLAAKQARFEHGETPHLHTV